MHRKLAGALLVATACALAAPALAHEEGDSLEGSCTTHGEIQFASPIGNEPRTTSFSDVAEGRCTGKLNGEPIEGEDVIVRSTGTGELSCLGSRVTGIQGTILVPRGPGVADDVEIDFSAESNALLTEVVSRFEGAVSGHAVSHATFRNHVDDRVNERCEAGTLESMRYDSSAQGVTPIVG